MLKIKPPEYDAIRDFIKSECGINLGDHKAYLIETRLSDLVLEYGCKSYMEFYNKSKHNPALVERIIDAMTTNETLWFRDQNVWDLIGKKIIPNLVEKVKAGKRMRVWFAACSTGQEVYTFLMLLNDHLDRIGQKRFLNNFDFVATDISPSVLFQAKSARYSGISIERGLSSGFRNRYFTNNGDVWSFDDSLRRKVRFEKLNLQKSVKHLGIFNLVFCRNVLIYFSPESKREIIGKIQAQMEAESPLILGSTESLRDFSDKFEIKSENNVIINYVKK